MRLLLTLVLVATGVVTPEASDYFPKGTWGAQDVDGFRQSWYSEHLVALAEPSLLAASRGDTPEVYRFLWLRTFHHPVSVRVVLGDSPHLELRVTSGAGGYEPGELKSQVTRKLRPRDVEAIRTAIRGLGFWELPTLVESNVVALDGSQWIIEGAKEGSYHVVDRWSPEEGPVYELGLLLLRMSRHKIKPIY